jgi:hypothetical protein
MNKKITFLLANIAFACIWLANHPLVAQPTLTRDVNFPQVDNLFNRMSCDTANVQPGVAGADVSWDFSNLDVATGFTSGTYVLPSATLFAGNFPGANLAEEFGDGSATFYNVSNAQSDLMGFVQVSTGGNVVVNYTNPQTIMQFPFTYGDNFTDDATRQYATITGDITTEVTADAYGLLTLPNGNFQNVLRIHSTIHVNDGGGTFILHDELYEWWSASEAQPILSIRMRTTTDGGVETKQKFVSYANIQGTGGGPDDYGYTWESSDGLLTCDWVDITKMGTLVTGLADDNVVGPINMGMDFQYYWTTIDKIWIGSNGYIAFEPNVSIASVQTGFPLIPLIDGNENFIAPLLSDLNFSGIGNPGQVYTYHDQLNDRFIVSFINAPFWTNNTTGLDIIGSNNFQIILSAADSTITFNYANMATEVATEYQTQANPVVVGIENPTGGIGTMISSAAIPTSNSCVRFFAPSVPLIDVIDVRPAYNQNADNGGFFAMQGLVTNLTTMVNNSGSVDITTPINITTTIINENGDIFGTPQTANLPNLAQGQSQSVTVWSDFPALEGNYTFQVETSNNSDINPGNNVNITEIVVVDSLNNGEIYLDYTPIDPIPGGVNVVSWQGAENYSDGAAVYFRPPFYPVQLIAAEFACQPGAGATSITAGFKTQVVKADEDKMPDEILSEKNINANEIPSGVWNRITFDSPITITDGGVFVSWLMENTGISLMTDVNPPFSRQTYEILSSTYAQYRESEVADFYIRAIVKSAIADGIMPNTTPTFSLLNLYPNPANNGAMLQFNLPQTATVQFTLTDMAGRVVHAKNLGQLNQGGHQLQINTENLPAGNYLYSLTVDGYSLSKPLVVVK